MQLIQFVTVFLALIMPFSIQQDEVDFPISYSEEEWQQLLSKKQYEVLRQRGTERAFTGAYWANTEKGVYYCAATGAPLFSSEAKFKSGTGWPSFFDVISSDAVKLIDDVSHGMRRVEVVDALSGSHLGHVFDDGPSPTYKRYCINSISLIFVEEGGVPPTIK